MLLKNKTLLIIAILLLHFTGTVNAQIETFYKKDILEKIKNGNTHVLIKDTNFPQSAKFLNAFKQAWTITKGVDFLKLSNLSENLFPGDTYFSLQPHISETQHGIFITFYLDLWMPDQSTIKKRKKQKFTEDDELAHIRLICDKQSGLGLMGDPVTHPLPFDFDGDGHLANWTPGILKNYLLQLSTAIKAGKKIDYTDDITNKAKLPELKTQILYFSVDAFRESGAFVGDGKFNDTTKILSCYKLKYKVVTNDKLNEKIANDKEPFYYSIFLTSGSCKMFGVVESQTGELIYSRYTKFSYNLKAGDLKELSKKAEK